MRARPTRRAVGWALAAVSLALLVSPASADPLPAGAEHSEAYFPSADGTLLHADVYRPAGHRRKVPVILLVSPYTSTFLTEEGAAVNYETFLSEGDVFRRGYAWVQVSLRGVGGSGGCSDMGGKG